MSKYNNPIAKPDMVQIPRWEYARLIEKSTKLNVLMDMLKNGDKYKAIDVIEIMANNNDEVKGVI